MRRLFLAVALAAVAQPAWAQSWQTLRVERRSVADSHLAIAVRHHAGRLVIQPTSDSVRYRASMRYDARAVEPLYRYGADSGLRIGTVERSDGSADRRGTNLELALGRTGTVSIDARAGAAETELNLGGLPLTSVSVASGAADTRVRFDQPNPVRLRTLTLTTGAASIRGEMLGNANAQEITVRTGVGEIDLDLSGQWQGDADVRAEVVLGALTIRVPADIGVRVEPSRFLASFSHSGLRQRDGAWVSANWDSAPRKVRIYAQTTLGFLTVEQR